MLQGNVRACNLHNKSCAAGQVLSFAMAYGSQGAFTHSHVAVRLSIPMSDNCSMRTEAAMPLH